ncbi:MAG: PrgI family protein [Candidatus Komeilibacteria bacterium]|nr:PrgI family protein [Candidatus Komeilibacteria bacterium]
MQKFIVPQFIDVENKILGPITVRQFITVAVGGVLIFASYKLADFTLFLFLAVVILLLAIIVAFVKFNGLPFHVFLLNVVGTYKKPMLRVWLKEEFKIDKPSKKTAKREAEEEEQKYFVPKKSISSEKLSELALIIDTGGIYKGEAEANRINRSLYYGK